MLVYALSCLRAKPPPSPVWCNSSTESSSIIVEKACEEVQALRDEDATDLDRVRALRSWASGWWPVSQSEITDHPDAYWKVDPTELFANGRDGRYGGPCGSAAWMLMFVYDHFGLDAWVYNFGNPEGPGTHVVTLVKVDGDIVVQDAHLNAELTEPAGRPTDVRQAIAEIAEDGISSVHVAYQQAPRRCLAENPAQCYGGWMGQREPEQKCTQLDYYPHNWVCEFPNFIGTNLSEDSRFQSSVSTFLSAHGRVPSYQTLMLHPINLTGTDGIAIFGTGTAESESQVLFNEIWSSIHG